MRKITLFALLLVIMSNEIILAKESCPENVQAVILLKVLGYTRKIGGIEKSNIVIGILNGGAMINFVKAAAEKAENTKITVKEVKASNLEGIDIVYIPKGTAAAEIKKVTEDAKKKKIFTIAGDPDMMNSYSVTFSVYLEDQRPRLVVDLESSEQEGVNFSAELLNITQIKK